MYTGGMGVMCACALCTQEQRGDSSAGSVCVSLGDVVTPGHEGVLPRLALHCEDMPIPEVPMGGSLC